MKVTTAIRCPYCQTELLREVDVTLHDRNIIMIHCVGEVDEGCYKQFVGSFMLKLDQRIKKGRE